MEFLRMWGDKVIMVGLFLVCLGVAVYAFYIKDGELSSTVVDLAKQILAGLLTLLVAARTQLPTKNGGTNGTTTSSNSTTPDTHV